MNAQLVCGSIGLPLAFCTDPDPYVPPTVLAVIQPLPDAHVETFHFLRQPCSPRMQQLSFMAVCSVLKYSAICASDVRIISKYPPPKIVDSA